MTSSVVNLGSPLTLQLFDYDLPGVEKARRGRQFQDIHTRRERTDVNGRLARRDVCDNLLEAAIHAENLCADRLVGLVVDRDGRVAQRRVGVDHERNLCIPGCRLLGGGNEAQVTVAASVVHPSIQNWSGSALKAPV